VPPFLPRGPHEPLAGEDFTGGTVPWRFAALGVLGLAGAVAAFRRREDPPAAARIVATTLGVGGVASALLLWPVVDDVKTWNAAVPRIREASRDARLVQMGPPDAALVWSVRPALVDLVAGDPADIPATLDALYAEDAPRVVAVVDVKHWDAARRAVPSLEARVKVVWARRVSHRVFAVLVPASDGG
jgi:hypothetical protein